MSETFEKLSETLKKSPSETLEILESAGIAGKKEGDVISHEEKMQVIQYLSKGKQAARRQRSTSQLKVMQGKAAKTVSIEVRKKTSYSKSKAAPAAKEARPVQVKKKTSTKTVRKKAVQMTSPKAPESGASKVGETPKSEKKSGKQAKAESKKTPSKTISATEAEQSNKAKSADTEEQNKPRKRLSIASDRSGKRKIKRQSRQTVSVMPSQKHGFEKPTAQMKREVVIREHMSVVDLAQSLAIKSGELAKKMMGMGIMTTINQSLDQDTAALIVEELGHSAVIERSEDAEAGLVDKLGDEKLEKRIRPPVVVVMGHVDHGKTSLLDYIRSTKVHSSEAGGITQHIGAYHVKTNKGVITFLDTPGHAAFTAMRARGTEVTDIAILVVAADDGVMPQTIEAIEHARAAKTPIIVALTKIDKEGVDTEKVRTGLTKHNIIPEAWGGDNIFVEVSSKSGQGVDELLDAISLQAEIMELKAPMSGFASGTVIEATLDKGRGVIATMLVRRGVLKKGDILLAGMEFGRVRAMLDEHGRTLSQASPSIPIGVLGFSGAPSAGDEFVVVENERQAKEVVDLRRQKQRTKQHLARAPVVHLDNLMKDAEQTIQSVNILLKADTRGTAEAIQDTLSKIPSDKVKVNILSTGVGGINVSDVNLAAASKALAVGFNVRADTQARRAAEKQDVAIHYYSIIYELVDSVTEMMGGLLEPVIKEEIVGIAQVKDTFRSSRFGVVAGCQVIEGTVRRGNPIRVLRDNIVIFEGGLESLRRFKEDVNEVKVGTECGIAVKDYNDVKLGDQIEVFQRIEMQRTL